MGLYFIDLQHRAHAQILALRNARHTLAAHDTPTLVQPRQGLKFGKLLQHGFGPRQKLLHPDFFVGHISGQAHDLLLALQQAQPEPLLSVFHIAFDGFLFALNFFKPQIPKCAGDGG